MQLMFASRRAERVGASGQSLAYKLKRMGTIACFLGPSLAVVFLVLIFPALGALYLSAHDFIRQDLVFVGMANYPDAMKDPAAWNALLVNVEFTFITVGLSLIMGLVLALLLNTVPFGRRFFRTVFMLPWPILSVVTGIIFVWMFHPQHGIANEILVRLGILAEYKSWLGDANSALPIVIFASVWKESPFFMIMILAGLQTIPQEQYEAAAVDGASAWQQFRAVTLPNLHRIIAIATMLQIIWRFREFDLVAVMTRGGPNKATEVLAVLVFDYAFQFFRFGRGAAVAVLMSLISLVFAIMYLRVVRLRKPGVR